MTALLLKIAMWIIQLMALISAINYSKHTKNAPNRVFLLLLIVVVIAEPTATLLKEVFSLKNYVVYNTLSVFSFFTYLYWFKCVKTKQWLIKVSWIIFVLAIAVSAITESFFYKLWNITWFTGAILVLLNAITYYSELLNQKDVVKYSDLPEFWLATGLLIYHIGFLPMLLFKDFFDANSLYYRIPILILNLILYGSFIIAFKCKKTQNI